MRKALLYLVLFGILCIALGILIGLCLTRLQARKFVARQAQSALSAPVDPERQQERIEQTLRRLDRRLGLSDAQKTQIEAILEESRLEVNVSWEGFRKTMFSSKEKAIRSIMQVLEPGQKEKFRQLIESRKKME